MRAARQRPRGVLGRRASSAHASSAHAPSASLAFNALACTALVSVLGSCANMGWQRRPVELRRTEVYTTSGLRFEDLALGDGPIAVTGDEVTLDYTVWLEDGTRVDSSLDRGVPIKVTIGSAALRALNQGLLGMQPGGRRRMVVPPELAYGAEGVEGMVPPNAPLTFEVHVLEVIRSNVAAK